MRRFPIRFTGFNHAMRLLGLFPNHSWVEVSEERIRVRMGWAFALDAPLDQVSGARPDTDRVWAWGVHGWGGRWLVNASSSGMTRIDFAPRARARLAIVPLKVSELRISVEDPDGLVAALEAAGKSAGEARLAPTPR